MGYAGKTEEEFFMPFLPLGVRNAGEKGRPARLCERTEVFIERA
jgi:hypothetical protein